MPIGRWMIETPNGVARNMIAKIVGNSTENPIEYFKKVALQYHEFEYVTPRMTAIHYLHLAK